MLLPVPFDYGDMFDCLCWSYHCSTQSLPLHSLGTPCPRSPVPIWSALPAGMPAILPDYTIAGPTPLVPICCYDLLLELYPTPVFYTPFLLPIVDGLLLIVHLLVWVIVSDVGCCSSEFVSFVLVVRCSFHVWNVTLFPLLGILLLVISHILIWNLGG